MKKKEIFEWKMPIFMPPYMRLCYSPPFDPAIDVSKEHQWRNAIIIEKKNPSKKDIMLAIKILDFTWKKARGCYNFPKKIKEIFWHIKRLDYYNCVGITMEVLF